jgi:hypothetical protein
VGVGACSSAGPAVALRLLLSSGYHLVKLGELSIHASSAPLEVVREQRHHDSLEFWFLVIPRSARFPFEIFGLRNQRLDVITQSLQIRQLADHFAENRHVLEVSPVDVGRTTERASIALHIERAAFRALSIFGLFLLNSTRAGAIRKRMTVL